MRNVWAAESLYRFGDAVWRQKQLPLEVLPKLYFEPQTTVKTGKDITVRLKNFGPFDDVNLELRPLTIFIGKNSVGKSLLLSLLWALSSTRPEIPSDEEIRMRWSKLYEKAESISLKITKVIEPVLSDLDILFEEVSKLIKSMATDVRDFTRTSRDLFKRAIEACLDKRLRQVFGVSPRGLVKAGETSAQIDIKGTCGNLHISLTDSVSLEINWRINLRYMTIS